MSERDFDRIFIRKTEPSTVPYSDPDDPAMSLPEFVPMKLKPAICHQGALAGSSAVAQFLRDKSSLSDFQISEISQMFYQEIHWKLAAQHSWLWQNLFGDAVNRGEVNDPRTTED
ncbi:hypothetical protein LCGC14_0890370 [marine sediment metagenome]|uniref:Uncharacterized protein n=1 Tax=marine sediment metagenome TaxID=412755 RepID=A0A0F9PK92_9ZZZZ